MPRLTSISIALTALFTLYMSNAARAADEVVNAATVQEVAVETYGDAYFEHELNDAWLGMPVKGLKGDIIGTVLDAPVDEDGHVVEVLVGEMVLSDDEEALAAADAEALRFPADQVELGDEFVTVLPLDPQLVARVTQ